VQEERGAGMKRRSLELSHTPGQAEAEAEAEATGVYNLLAKKMIIVVSSEQ